MTIEKAIEAWLVFMAADGCRPATLKSFASLIRRLAKAAEWQTIADINLDHAAKFIADNKARKVKPWGGTTADAYVVMMRCFGGYLVKAGHLKTNPLESLPDSGEGSAAGARPLPFEQARDLIEVFCAHISDKRASLEAAVMAATLFKTGWRPAMLYGIRECDVVLEHEFPHYVTHPTWTKNKQRQEIALDVEAVFLLRWLLNRFGAKGKERVCPQQFTLRTWKKYVREAKIAYGTSVSGKASPYSGRKSFATWLGRAGVDNGIKQWLLAHYDPYDKPDLKSQSEALSRLPQIWPITARKYLDNSGSSSIIFPAGPETPVENSYNLDQVDPLKTARPAIRSMAGGSRSEGGSGPSTAKNQHDNGRNRAGKLGDRQVLIRALAVMERQTKLLEIVIEELGRPEGCADEPGIDDDGAGEQPSDGGAEAAE